VFKITVVILMWNHFCDPGESQRCFLY
jgi:hypothetical protein